MESELPSMEQSPYAGTTQCRTAVLLTLRLVSKPYPLRSATDTEINPGIRCIPGSSRLAARRMQDQPLSVRLRHCVRRRRLLQPPAGEPRTVVFQAAAPPP